MIVMPSELGIGPMPLAPADTDWLRNTLGVSGAAAAVGRFQAAARGSGIIPWQRDLDRMEEDWFLPMAAPADGVRAISLAGARILACRPRDSVALQQQRALLRATTDQRCPFDLHRLRPVPAAILQLGPEDPQSRDWLWRHWGTTRALRHTRLLPSPADRRNRQTDHWLVEFWAADWSPWPALKTLRRTWPDLTLSLRPHYGDGADG